MQDGLSAASMVRMTKHGRITLRCRAVLLMTRTWVGTCVRQVRTKGFRAMRFFVHLVCELPTTHTLSREQVGASTGSALKRPCGYISLIADSSQLRLLREAVWLNVHDLCGASSTACADETEATSNTVFEIRQVSAKLSRSSSGLMGHERKNRGH
eukprot:6110937-Pleurochrysis_carterae.AAC.1